ncbi:hypothetical protein BGM26_05895 [Bacillus sp. FJAT-29790]|uniref:hypothetical protein n=1 Tax=Bacillus sp. FJAT-29790 TaxID=1895002 RepID=UPI001C23C0BC|nr:hypothetical protein [Bacillus sp. FJAT-29790]MBU8878520.1 hypothetical protein [Bacillus sp. FJAT-29790]
MYTKLGPITCSDFHDFTKYWAALYSYKPKHPKGNELYNEHIQKSEFSEEDLYALFTWKNGMTLSKKKKETVKQITEKIHLINSLKGSDQVNVDYDLDFLSDGVWKIFLLHLINPEYYPLFDQHTYRAFQYIQTELILEIPKDNKQWVKLYFDEYLPYIHEHSSHEGLKMTEIDQALFTFGQFLKSPFVQMLSPALNTDFLLRILSSVYSRNVNGTYDFSIPLKDFLAKNPDCIPHARNLLEIRDYLMQEEHYHERWDMGRYLMGQFGIEFAQSEGSELIFSLCLAIKKEYSISDRQVGYLLVEALSRKFVN